MCLGKPECQACQTCGRRKYQLWISEEMHDRGCPFGAATADQCSDARNHAGMLQWAYENDVEPTPSGIAFLATMERANAVDRTDRLTPRTGGLQ